MRTSLQVACPWIKSNLIKQQLIFYNLKIRRGENSVSIYISNLKIKLKHCYYVHSLISLFRFSLSHVR